MNRTDPPNPTTVLAATQMRALLDIASGIDDGGDDPGISEYRRECAAALADVGTIMFTRAQNEGADESEREALRAAFHHVDRAVALLRGLR